MKLNLRTLRRALLRDARGATAVEYGLILSLVVLGAFAAINGLAGTTTSLWNSLDNKVAEVS